MYDSTAKHGMPEGRVGNERKVEHGAVVALSHARPQLYLTSYLERSML